VLGVDALAQSFDEENWKMDNERHALEARELKEKCHCQYEHYGWCFCPRPCPDESPQANALIACERAVQER
jgi:hypothetical protein